MAASTGLSEEDISRIVNQKSSDEGQANTVSLTEESDVEHNGIVEDFRLAEDVDAASSSDNEMTLQEIAQVLRNHRKRKYDMHKWSRIKPVRLQMPQRNIILHIAGYQKILHCNYVTISCYQYNLVFTIFIIYIIICMKNFVSLQCSE